VLVEVTSQNKQGATGLKEKLIDNHSLVSDYSGGLE
jgi:hypothetical protein